MQGVTIKYKDTILEVQQRMLPLFKAAPGEAVCDLLFGKPCRKRAQQHRRLTTSLPSLGPYRQATILVHAKHAWLYRAAHKLDPIHVVPNGLCSFQKSEPPSKDNNVIRITSCWLRALWLTKYSPHHHRGYAKGCPLKDRMFESRSYFKGHILSHRYQFGRGGVSVKIQPPLECLTGFPTSKSFGNRNMYLMLKQRLKLVPSSLISHKALWDLRVPQGSGHRVGAVLRVR